MLTDIDKIKEAIEETLQKNGVHYTNLISNNDTIIIKFNEGFLLFILRFWYAGGELAQLEIITTMHKQPEELASYTKLYDDIPCDKEGWLSLIEDSVEVVFTQILQEKQQDYSNEE